MTIPHIIQINGFYIWHNIGLSLDAIAIRAPAAN